MHRIPLILVLTAALLLPACGGGAESSDTAPDEETTVYAVRGQFVMYQYEGEAILVDHEEIPDFMAAMRMAFRAKDVAEIEGLEPGDKIAFRYVVGESGSHIEGVELLPPETELELAAGAEH